MPSEPRARRASRPAPGPSRAGSRWPCRCRRRPRRAPSCSPSSPRRSGRGEPSRPWLRCLPCQLLRLLWVWARRASSPRRPSPRPPRRPRGRFGGSRRAPRPRRLRGACSASAGALLDRVAGSRRLRRGLGRAQRRPAGAPASARPPASAARPAPGGAARRVLRGRARLGRSAGGCGWVAAASAAARCSRLACGLARAARPRAAACSSASLRARSSASRLAFASASMRAFSSASLRAASSSARNCAWRSPTTSAIASMITLHERIASSLPGIG